MDLLLDTHTLLWFYSADTQLSDKAKQIILDPTNDCFVSIASLWEISIKYNLGKLELVDSLDIFFSFIRRNQFNILHIEFNHLLQLGLLPHAHKDPFDRIIIAQGISENLTIATKDDVFKNYTDNVLW